MLWIDVTGLREYIASYGSVTGIQRTSLELIREMVGHIPFRLVEFKPDLTLWSEVTFEQLTALEPVSAVSEKRSPSGMLERLLPEWIRKAAFTSPGFKAHDLFFVPGVFWQHSGHADYIYSTISKYQMKLFLIIYDLIPIIHSGWFDRESVRQWERRYALLARRSTRLFAISQHTAATMRSYNSSHGLPDDVAVLRLGDTHLRSDLRNPQIRTDVQPAFVLNVSTIDTRKNQKMLVEIWNGLVERLGPDVPRLVLLGKSGVGSQEVFDLIEQFPALSGHVIVKNSVSDDELSLLYRSCLFTVFPSLAEGWGFPVIESLVSGKACIASSIDSVPEVGGDLCEYVDPTNIAAWASAIERLLLDGSLRAEMEARITREFRQTPWSTTADTILSELQKSAVS